VARPDHPSGRVFSFRTRAMVNLLYQKGAYHYIRKPGDFSKLKQAINEVLVTITSVKKETISKEKFIIESR
jgi:DNA-binding NarL/FixJ family response regulator